MDFGQLVSKLNMGNYTSNLHFFRDVRHYLFDSQLSKFLTILGIIDVK